MKTVKEYQDRIDHLASLRPHFAECFRKDIDTEIEWLYAQKHKRMIMNTMVARHQSNKEVTS